MLSVRERGETVATLRWIHVRLMETIASWVPTTPEMEVKLLFGAHIWDVAQHADALGKRTYELRMPLQHSLQPTESYQQWLGQLAQIKDTGERLASFYEVVLPALAARYADYLGRTDLLLDAPSVRILEHIGREQGRMIDEFRQLLAQQPSLVLHERATAERLRAGEAAIGAFVVHRAEQSATRVS
jgi:hypothetical protein